MKRTLMRTAAVLVLGGMLLTGCGKAAKPPQGPAPTVAVTPSAATVPATGSVDTGSVDNQLNDVDGLLSQIDGQVSADSQTPSDSD